jgi:hypothetical protein
MTLKFVRKLAWLFEIFMHEIDIFFLSYLLFDPLKCSRAVAVNQFIL